MGRPRGGTKVSEKRREPAKRDTKRHRLRRRTGLATRNDRLEQHHRPSRPRGWRGGPARRESAPSPLPRGASPPSSPHPATRLATPSPSLVSPRSGTAEGGHEQCHRYQHHHAGAGELCGPCSGPLARRPGTWRPHAAPRLRLAGQNRRHRVGTLYGAPGLTEAGLGGAQGGWAILLPRCAKSRGSGRPLRVADGGGSDARSGCWPEDTASAAILDAPGASSRAERCQLVARVAG